MKKLISLLMIVAVALSLFGCSNPDYDKAVELYNDGAYEDAWELFESLGDYEDSADWALKARYQWAIDLAASENYEKACENFDALGDYEDSELKAKEARYQWAIDLCEFE